MKNIKNICTIFIESFNFYTCDTQYILKNIYKILIHKKIHTLNKLIFNYKHIYQYQKKYFSYSFQ